MRSRLLVVALLCLLPSVVGAQDFIRYYPPAGAAGLSSSGTAITSTVPLLFPVGTEAAPSISFSGDPDTGLYNQAANRVGVTLGGSLRVLFVVSEVRMYPGDSLGWTSGVVTGTGLDTSIMREAAAILQHGVDAATATAQTIKGPDSTGATVAGASLTLKGGAGTSGIANGGALILAGGANSSTGEPGAVTISDGGTKPTCDSARRGAIWYDAGGAGVADTFEICSKSAADAYAWRSTSVLIP